MKKLFAIIGCLMMAGCATSMDQYQESFARVNKSDGISREEAVWMAQKQLIDMAFNKLYDIEQANVLSDVTEVPGSDSFWLVSFPEKQKSQLPYVFMVMIHKETGKIQYADDLPPDKMWILEAAILSGRKY